MLTVIRKTKDFGYGRVVKTCKLSTRLLSQSHRYPLSPSSTGRRAERSAFVLTSKLPSLNASNSLLVHRQLSLSAARCYEVVLESKEHSHETDLKPDAVDIFKTAVQAVHPKSMIENVLEYNRKTSTLKVQDKFYKIDRNVFVVGVGKAVLGMARVVENVLGHHVVAGVISIPSGLQEEMRNANQSEMFLDSNSKIQIYEGAADNEVDEPAHNASKAIHSLVSKLTSNDLVIVLCSGGGSTLLPSPYPPITLEDLHKVTRLLARNGANIKELNTVRKNIEILKGGGLALEAKPAKVLSLILSSIVGDPLDLIASGPTCPSQPTPHHCLEILQRLGIMDKTPESIIKFLEKDVKQMNMIQAQTFHTPMHAKAAQDALWEDVQNVIVGNNLLACEAAASRATELGYLPLILTTVLRGEAREIGYLYAKLAKFIMMCFDRKLALDPSVELTMLEVELVSGGIRKGWINHIVNSIDRAHNMNKDICVIAGGETVISITGDGIGGKNMESALAAAIKMKEEFRMQEMNASETRMCFLSCDSDGHDGVTKMAGAVIDQDFLDLVESSGMDMKEYMENNDSFTLFSKVNAGRNLVKTNLTGTNIMDLVIMLVQKPRERKYHWN